MDRINKEANVYHVLEQLQFLGAPRFFSTDTISDPIGMKRLRIEKLKCSLYNMYGHGRVDNGSGIDKKHYDKNEPPISSLPIHEFFDVAYQLVLILAFLHDKMGYAHRDIKTDNICIDREGYVCVVDYEFACPIADCGERSLGTRIYAAPEVMNSGAWTRQYGGGLPYTEKVDIWSYGVTLIELFCGLDFDSTSVCLMDQERVDQRIDKLMSRRLSQSSEIQHADAVSLVKSCLCVYWPRRTSARELAMSSVFIANISQSRRRDLEARFKY